MKTRAEILIALAQGFTLVNVTNSARMKLSDQGLMWQRVSDNSEWWPQNYNFSDLEWEIYEEPNPYPKGTYQWAKEEHARGKSVKLFDRVVVQDCLWGVLNFSDGEFTSSNWKLA